MSIVTLQGVAPRIHPSAFVAEGAHVIGNVEVGEDASIWFNSVLRGDINLIHIGDRTNVQDGSIFHVTNELPVHVGNDVTVGHRAIVHGCSVGDGSLIGMGSIVLDRARIGKQALVAAGAVVLEGFVLPDGMLAAGVPAKILRPLTEKEKLSLLESAEHYVRYAQAFRTSTTRT
ncbi:MAG: isoleucine patch superfamily enzyme, carbonic anhydrase/acetyltransferase [Bacteroidetes bacterium]|nr:isoleucine patch superfamily enzyme, carbonic anhydrase/acetyltransferase [Bacteroidota bacterium]